MCGPGFNEEALGRRQKTGIEKREEEKRGEQMRKLETTKLALAAGVLLLGSAVASAQTPRQETSSRPPDSTAQSGSMGTTPGSQSTSGTTSTTGSSTTTASTTTGGKETMKDSHFIKNAAEAGTTEVELGRLGADKAAGSDVKQFAQHMVDDHSKNNTELTSLASSKNVDIAAVTDKARKSADKLSDKSGVDFDKAFMKKMVADHKKVVREFESEAKNGKDPDVKAFAEKTLPTLRQHLQEAESIYDGLKNTKTTKTTAATTTKTSS
jgi:putative membrane protein